MVDLSSHREQITRLCEHFGVRALELFGSGATDQFDPKTSDLDFLVLFSNRSDLDPVEQYFGLIEELEKLFNRHVDLVDIKAARNPYFIAEALKHRVRLYAA